MTVWLCIAATALVSFAIKALGPTILGQRPLSGAFRAVIALLAPALLVALVVVQLMGPGWSSLDVPVLAGVALALIARWLKLHMLVAVLLGVLFTAILRFLF